MKNTKKKTFVYEAFGFPVKLINVLMKKVVGEWVLDVDFATLEKAVLKLLIHKSTPLTGAEIRFVRKYLQLSTKEFGKLCGVSHPAVLKWEGGKAKAPIPTDIYIRLCALSHLKAKAQEFRSLIEEMTAENLLLQSKKRRPTFSINVEEELKSA
jgi:DNA-binding transcriptional regulator YiaG